LSDFLWLDFRLYAGEMVDEAKMKDFDIAEVRSIIFGQKKSALIRL
jgi:hypothetical protein